MKYVTANGFALNESMKNVCTIDLAKSVCNQYKPKRPVQTFRTPFKALNRSSAHPKTF